MRVEIVAFRQGDFWHEPVRAGQVLELPDKVAQYLIDVGAAKVDEPVDEPKAAKGKAKP